MGLYFLKTRAVHSFSMPMDARIRWDNANFHVDCTTSFLYNYKHNLSLMMRYVVTLWQNWHEESSIARMLHLVENSMNCNHVAIQF